MSDSPELKTTVKVGILGDKYVGKSYLFRKLAGLNYSGYVQTTTVSDLKSEKSKETTNFVYVDNPALDKQSIVSIGSVYQYDILVFLFKDCESFTKLFEFFETIKQTLNNQYDHHVRQYWSHPKKIFAVYTNFQSTLEVQLQQLFKILIQEISLFCPQVTFETFILQKQSQNWKDLQFLIQKEPVSIYVNQEVSEMSTETKSATLKKQQSQKQSQKVVEIQQLKKQEPELIDERVEFLTQQQKTEEIVINTQLQQIRDVKIAEQTKQIETSSVEVITQQERSKQHIKVQHEKQEQQHLRTSNISKQKQTQSQRAKNNQKSFLSANNQQQTTQEIKINVQQVRLQNQEQGLIKKQDIRKQNIMKKIQQSFYGSQIQVDQNRKSAFVHQDAPQQYVEVKKTQEVQPVSKAQDFLSSFRKQQEQPNPKIEQQLNNYNKHKNEKLHNQNQISEEQVKQVNIQQSIQQPKITIGSLKIQQNSKINQTRRMPQSQISNKRRPVKQKTLKNESSNCSCQLM